MSRKIVEFESIRLEPADNGFVLEYTEVSEKTGSMDNRDWSHRQMVFVDGDTEALDDALAKMKEMYTFNKLRKGGSDNPSIPSTESSVIRG